MYTPDGKAGLGARYINCPTLTLDRVNGGGGYVMYKGAREIYRSSEEVREMIINWVEHHPHIPIAPSNNWRLVPAADSGK